ncbi:hypothetical protein NXC24_PB00173 (plasmid) [Rhizobium sp. NXC24]|nr:hypothetical protein NXC24_PB00173 [Rhizobium sp. NXC24]
MKAGTALSLVQEKQKRAKLVIAEQCRTGMTFPTGPISDETHQCHLFTERPKRLPAAWV